METHPAVPIVRRRGRRSGAALGLALASVFVASVAAPVLRGQDAGPAAAATDGAAGKALLTAAADGQLEEVELLLRQGAAVDFRNEQGETPLLLAALGAHPGVVGVLLEAGADPDAASSDGTTPLLAAVIGAGELKDDAPDRLPVYRRVAQILLGAGADPAAEDGFGYTALDNARAYELEELIALLEKAATWKE